MRFRLSSKRAELSNLSSHSWTVLLAAGVLIYNVVNGAVTGRALLLFTSAKRSEEPALYWLAMLVSGVLGVGGLLTLFFQFG